MTRIGGYYRFPFGDETTFYARECHLLWWLRKSRLNCQIFKTQNPSQAEINEEEKSRGFFWINHWSVKILYSSIYPGISHHEITLGPCSPVSEPIEYLYLTGRTDLVIQCLHTPSLASIPVHVIIIPCLDGSIHVLTGLTAFFLALPNVSFLWSN